MYLTASEEADAVSIGSSHSVAKEVKNNQAPRCSNPTRHGSLPGRDGLMGSGLFVGVSKSQAHNPGLPRFLGRDLVCMRGHIASQEFGMFRSLFLMAFLLAGTVKAHVGQKSSVANFGSVHMLTIINVQVPEMTTSRPRT